MLTLIKLVRKLFQQLKSDLTPHQLAVGVFFGVLWGLTPAGLHWAAIFLVALLLNCSMAAMALVAAALKPLGFLVASGAFALGFTLLEGGGWYSHVVAGVSGAPVLAFLGFERYVVAGAYAIAFPAGTMAALITRIGVAEYRTKWAKKWDDAAWVQRVTKNPLSRLIVNLIFGKSKDFVERKPRFILLRPFRPYMLVFVPLLAIGLTIGGGLYAQSAIGGLAAGTASRALGVQVSFGSIDYSFFAQKLRLERFQLPDPSAPKENLLEIGTLEADLGFLELLRGRLQFEKLAAADVATRVARETDGTLNVTKLPALQPAPDAPEGEQAAWQEYLTWLTQKSKAQDWNELWRKYQEYRTKSAQAKKPVEAPKAPAYDASLAWKTTRPEPRVRVDLFEVRNVRLDVVERGGPAVTPSFTGFELKGADLSSKPGWNGRPLVFSAAGSLDGGKAGTLKADFKVLAASTEGKVELTASPLLTWKALFEKSLPVAVEQGTANVGLSGRTEAGGLQATSSLRIDGLKIAARPGETRILGLDPQMSAYAIQGLNAYGAKQPILFDVTLGGRLDAPEMSTGTGLLDLAKKGLESLGQKELDAVITKFGTHTKSLQAGDVKALPAAKEDVKKEVEKGKETIEGLKGLFKKPKDEKKP